MDASLLKKINDILIIYNPAIKGSFTDKYLQ